MALSAPETVRILRFCLGVHDSADAGVRTDGTCAVTITLWRPGCEIRTFEGASFEEALRRAAAADVLKAACVDRQIAFFAQAEEPVPAPGGAPPPPPRAATTASALALESDDDVESRFLTVADTIEALLHETQRERGISTLVAGSGGRLLGGELDRQWRRTEARRVALNEILGGRDLPGAVRRRLDRCEGLLASLGKLRSGIREGAVRAPEIIEAYSAVNAALLSAIDAFMMAGGMGGPLSSTLAYVALLHAKEKTGQERAELAHVFLEDRLTEPQRLQLAALLAAQSSYLHIFSAAAPRAAEQLLRRSLASPAAVEVQRMESVTFGDAEHGFGVDPLVWFETMTRKIEMLGAVSRTVLGILREG